MILLRVWEAMKTEWSKQGIHSGVGLSETEADRPSMGQRDTSYMHNKFSPVWCSPPTNLIIFDCWEDDFTDPKQWQSSAGGSDLLCGRQERLMKKEHETSGWLKYWVAFILRCRCLEFSFIPDVARLSNGEFFHDMTTAGAPVTCLSSHLPACYMWQPACYMQENPTKQGNKLGFDWLGFKFFERHNTSGASLWSARVCVRERWCGISGLRWHRRKKNKRSLLFVLKERGRSLKTEKQH